MVASMSLAPCASRPWRPASTRAPYGATRAPVASVTLSASATSSFALPKSPPSATAWAITFTLTASTASAPASRASWTPCVATPRQVS